MAALTGAPAPRIRTSMGTMRVVVTIITRQTTARTETATTMMNRTTTTRTEMATTETFHPSVVPDVG